MTYLQLIMSTRAVVAIIVYIDESCGSKTIDKVYIDGSCGSKTIDKV